MSRWQNWPRPLIKEAQMIKSELMEALEDYEDDTEVYITLPGAGTIYDLERVTFENGNLVLEAEEAPDFSDLKGMAEAHYEEYGHRIIVMQEDI